MREFLPPHVSAVCGRDSAFSSVPFAAVDSEGIAAVVDISGFTSLTSSLLEKHGTDGAAVLRETLKNAFSKIIERIYSRSGAIVKFAGDAAIACWSTMGSNAHRLTRITQSFVCCLEILYEFREETRCSSDDLGIHIGIGIGQLYHVHVGKPEGQSEGPDRREYFIAGEAVSDAGIKYYQALASILAGAQGAYHLRMLSDRIAHEGRGAFIIKDRSSHFEGALTYFQREFPEDVTVPASKKGSIDRRKAVAYVEVSVAAFIRQSGFIADLDNDGYSDIRNTTVVFFRFPYLTIDLSAMAEADLSKVQKISQEIIASVHAEGGSLRQINFDDKGFNALAVWGLRGLAHQRGEAGYALAACLNLFKALHKDGETVSQYRFTAGVASGTIYAGLIGSRLRADGTVLGSPVNIAARLMCIEDSAESTTEQYARIFCDGATYECVRKEFEFTRITRALKLKGEQSGLSDETTVYQVNKALLPTALLDQSKVSEGGGDELFGRSAEQESILQEVKSWENAPQRKLVLLTGRSGLGKSALLNRLRSEIKQWDSVILVVSECAGDEVKQRMSFGALIQIFRCIALKLRAAGVSAQDFRSDQSKSSSLSDSHLASRYALYSNASLSDLPDIKDPDWAYLARVLEALGISRATSRLLAIIPGMKAFHVQERLSGGDLTERVAVIIHRILEEWEDSGQFDDYRSASTCWIELQPLSALALSEFVHAQLGHDIPQSLIVDIQAKTNGVPIAVLVALRSMKLANREDASSSISHLVMDREKAISAHSHFCQDGYTPKSLQTILAVASIIGQTFDLETVAGAIRNLDYSCEVGQTASDVETEIRNGDRFGLLVCKSTDGKDDGNLIHRAVIRTLEEQLLNGGDDSILLPIIIGHAMSLDDELALKSSYLHLPFITKRGEELFVLFLVAYLKNSKAITLGPGLLSNNSLVLQVSALKTKMARAIRCLIYHVRTVFSLRGAKPPEKFRIGFAYLRQMYPSVFRECFPAMERYSEKARLKKIFTESDVTPELAVYVRNIMAASELSYEIHASGIAQLGILDLIFNWTCMTSTIILLATILSSTTDQWRNVFIWPYKLSLHRFGSILRLFAMKRSGNLYERMSETVTDQIYSFDDFIRKGQLAMSGWWARVWSHSDEIADASSPDSSTKHFCTALTTSRIGKFHPDLPEAEIFRIDDEIDYFSANCPTALPVLTLKLCQIIEAVLLCHPFDAKSFYESEEAKNLFVEMKRSGMPMSNTTVIMGYGTLVLLDYENRKKRKETEKWLENYDEAIAKSEPIISLVAPIMISRRKKVLTRFAADCERIISAHKGVLSENQILVLRARRLRALWLTGRREVLSEVDFVIASMERFDIEWERRILKEIKKN
ncbi:hypothetical protein DFJ73DRAFT_929755 [Zopfochytrium polystomum]|nr:hypothetical protein DFJ73DRAFT_929755 [Zopfochytrium polystomum]